MKALKFKFRDLIFLCHQDKSRITSVTLIAEPYRIQIIPFLRKAPRHLFPLKKRQLTHSKIHQNQSICSNFYSKNPSKDSKENHPKVKTGNGRCLFLFPISPQTQHLLKSIISCIIFYSQPNNIPLLEKPSKRRIPECHRLKIRQKSLLWSWWQLWGHCNQICFPNKAKGQECCYQQDIYGEGTKMELKMLQKDKEGWGKWGIFSFPRGLTGRFGIFKGKLGMCLEWDQGRPPRGGEGWGSSAVGKAGGAQPGKEKFLGWSSWREGQRERLFTEQGLQNAREQG